MSTPGKQPECPVSDRIDLGQCDAIVAVPGCVHSCHPGSEPQLWEGGATHDRWISVVDVLPGIAGAVTGGWLFNFFGGTDVTGFDIGSLYSASAAVIGAIIIPTLYRVFLRRRMV